MPLWTCETCGAQFPASEQPPASCPVCEDERQFVNWKGQTFLTREELAERHRASVRSREREVRRLRADREVIGEHYPDKRVQVQPRMKQRDGDQPHERETDECFSQRHSQRDKCERFK